MTENLKIYEAGRSVPQEAQKQFNNGRFSGTDINPMWRIKKLTELFGPAGIGWYYKILSERAETVGDTVMAIVDLELYIKYNNEWSMPIYGTGGNVLLAKGRASDEGYKMALTDALSVACKALGIGADIYYSKDKTKYTEQQGGQEPRYDNGRSVPGSTVCRKCGCEVDPENAAYSYENCGGMILCPEHQKAYFDWKRSRGGNQSA
jgi:hypothetical protein